MSRITRDKNNSMQVRMQRTMGIILVITMALLFVLMTWLVYSQTMVSMKSEVKQEAVYIQKALNIAGNDYLKEVGKFSGDNRLTLIDTDGRVLYDSMENEDQMPNHKNRQEVKTALGIGIGEDLRLSDTLGKQTFYYALLLENGEVLRVAKTTDSVLTTVFGILPYMLGIGAVMLLFAWALGKWQTSRLIEPINTLDLDEPLENEIYSELRPLMSRIDRQNKEKEQAGQMRKDFSANVSHELKTPLTSISGYAEIMKDGLVRPEDMPKFSERIYNEASRLITLIEDIIRLSKLDDEAVELEKQEVELYSLTREIVSRLAPQAEKRSIQMEVTGEEVTYYGIRQILDEMVYNICENAVKYNKAGGSIKIWVGNTLKGAKIIVEDTGIGIPADQKDRIFERFYRVDKSHSKETGGTGLGLSIVKHGAILHSAAISVESELGKGTKIEIIFPRHKRLVID